MQNPDRESRADAPPQRCLSVTDPRGRRSLIEIALGVITEVRGGEEITALLLTLQIFLTLTAYYIIKPVREALILEDPDGAVYKAYATAAIAVLMLLVVPVYSAFADRLTRNRLVIGAIAFFVACLVVFYGLGQSAGVRPYLGIPFYLWVGVFNMMVVAQFWAFANDIYTPEQGKRIFAMVAIGQAVGAWLGGRITAFLLDPPTWWLFEKMTVYSLLLVSAVCLAATGLLTQVVHRRGSGAGGEGATPGPEPKPEPEPEPTTTPSPAIPSAELDRTGAFALVFRSRYLLLLAAFSLVFTFVNTNGENILGFAVSDMAPAAGEVLDGLERRAWIGQFYGDFYSWVNLVGFLLQAFLVSRIIKYTGMRVAFLILPVIVIGGAGLIALFPVLAVLRWEKTVENATDYSLNNTIRQMLWLPTTAEMKYKAKQAVDTFFVRMGDAGSGLLVFLGVTFFSLSVRGFAIVNILLGVVWLLLAAAIIRENAKMTKEKDSSEATPAEG